MKDTRSGRRYTHNICRPCRIEENHKSRLKRLKKDPKYDSRKAMDWNKSNRNKYNRRRNLWAKRNRRKSWGEIYELT